MERSRARNDQLEWRVGAVAGPVSAWALAAPAAVVVDARRACPDDVPTA